MRAAILLSASFLFLLHVQACSSSQVNIVEICKQVVDDEHTNFCVQTLKENPKAQVADKTELTKIVLDLTLQCFKKTSKKVDVLKKSYKKGGEEHTALQICDQAYNRALDKLEQVPARYKKGGFTASANQLSAGMDQATSCIDAFEKTGAPSLLATENEECLTLVMFASKIMEKSAKS